jgi:mannose-6-phosphate isomerase-like protein (cupin superfamily)
MARVRKLSKQEIRTLTESRWKAGTFIERIDVKKVVLPPHEHLPWVKHECMRAKLVSVTAGEVGELILKFPPNGQEDLEMHTHPVSDRIITVLEGRGVFRSVRHGVPFERVLEPGDVVYMPRGVFHTFLGLAEPLMVHAMHNPWVPMDHEDNIRYADGTTSREYHDWDGAESVDKHLVPQALTAAHH